MVKFIATDDISVKELHKQTDARISIIYFLSSFSLVVPLFEQQIVILSAASCSSVFLISVEDVLFLTYIYREREKNKKRT